MDILKVERTQTTPLVIFDPDEFILSIKGASRPQDAKAFFEPMFNWLEEFYRHYNKTSSILLNIEVKLSYFNSASFLNLIELFRIIKKIHNAGLKVIIEWYYSEDDEVIFEAGEELSDISELPFNFIEE